MHRGNAEELKPLDDKLADVEKIDAPEVEIKREVGWGNITNLQNVAKGIFFSQMAKIY